MTPGERLAREYNRVYRHLSPTAGWARLAAPSPEWHDLSAHMQSLMSRTFEVLLAEGVIEPVELQPVED